VTYIYATCSACGHEFWESDIDEWGNKIECPSCGKMERDLRIDVSDSVHVTSSESVGLDAIIVAKPNIEAQFDIEQIIDGRTIIECSGLVGQKAIEFYKKYPEELKLIDRRKFEELVAELFDGFGYEVELTKQTRDGGKDIIAVRRAEVKVKYLIECKRPDPGGYVGVGPVRELLGVKNDENATKGLLVTTAYFSKDAKLFFERHSWVLEAKEFTDLQEWIDLYIKLKEDN
jgi:HJR/Mrr/RecB family endonuclease/DNA-directed RNA polymerase subunit RPC12/RpoP